MSMQLSQRRVAPMQHGASLFQQHGHSREIEVRAPALSLRVGALFAADACSHPSLSLLAAVAAGTCVRSGKSLLSISIHCFSRPRFQLARYHSVDCSAHNCIELLRNIGQDDIEQLI